MATIRLAGACILIILGMGGCVADDCRYEPIGATIRAPSVAATRCRCGRPVRQVDQDRRARLDSERLTFELDERDLELIGEADETSKNVPPLGDRRFTRSPASIRMKLSAWRPPTARSSFSPKVPAAGATSRRSCARCSVRPQRSARSESRGVELDDDSKRRSSSRLIGSATLAAMGIGQRDVIPLLACSDIRAEHDFLVTALGMESGGVEAAPDGSVVHAEVRSGSRRIWLHRTDESERLLPPAMSGSAHGGLVVHVPDVDAVYERARATGATILYAPREEDYGQREFGLRDPDGHLWWIATPAGRASRGDRVELDSGIRCGASRPTYELSGSG